MGISFSVHLDFSSQLVFLTKLIVCVWPHPRGYLNTEDLIHFASSYSLWTWYLQNCCAILEVGERSHYLSWMFSWMRFECFFWMRSKWKQEISNRPRTYNSLCGMSLGVRVALEAIVGGDARWRFDNHNKSHHQRDFSLYSTQNRNEYIK